MPGGGATKLTPLGPKLARLPVDPRLGRMILEARHHDCLREVLIITAALSIQDPRERPADTREAADAMHARFAEPGSDFLAYLTLWGYLHDKQAELSGSAFRRLCRREYLHYLRVREWQDLYGQLRQAAKEVGAGTGRETGSPRSASGNSRDTHPSQAVARTREPEPGARYPAELANRVHMSLLAGLLSHIGMLDTETKPGRKRRGPAEFAGARGARFAIFPDSVLARKPPAWVVAAELVETSRLWARTAARIEPEWAEQLAAHLVKRSYSEPHWSARRGAAMAAEKVTLYGLPIVAARQVSYARVDPAAARELFITHALVEGDWQTHHKFFHDNQRLLEEARDLEDKARRRGLVADDAVLFDFYDQRIPKDVASARHFDTWWKKARGEAPDLLTLTFDDLAGPASGQIQPGRLSRQLGRAAAVLRVRARCARGRGDRGHSAGRAGPGGRRRTRLAGAGQAGGTGHRADQVPAEGTAPGVRARAGRGQGGRRPAGRTARQPAGRAGRGTRPPRRGADPAGRLG